MEAQAILLLFFLYTPEYVLKLPSQGVVIFRYVWSTYSVAGHNIFAMRRKARPAADMIRSVCIGEW